MARAQLTRLVHTKLIHTRLARTRVIHALLACILLAAGTAAFADYPDRSIRMVLPFPAGGAADAIARTLAQRMTQSLGQPVLVDNKPGAEGLIAGDFVAKAAPDGYTILFGAGTGMTYAPLAHRQVPYDPVKDFSPIGLVSEAAFFLYVNESVPARTVQELIALARNRPGTLNHGSATAFSILAGMQFAQGANVRIVDVPYKGEAPMFQDLMAGRVQMSIASGGGLAYTKDGRVRVLATTLPARSALAPDVPTFAELGIAPVKVSAWAGMFAPAGVPQDVVQKLGAELRGALARPEVREQIERLAFQPRPSTPAEFGAFVKDQLVVWKQAMDAAGIKPQ